MLLPILFILGSMYLMFKGLTSIGRQDLKRYQKWREQFPNASKEIRSKWRDMTEKELKSKD